MPLFLTPVGEKCRICRIGGTGSMRQHLADMGLTEGTEVTVLSNSDGNMIIEAKNVRLALNRSLAAKINV